MEERFQKQIEGIANVNKLRDYIEEEEEIERIAIERRQEKERERFYEYVQKNFIEYVLNTIDKFTREIGKVNYIHFEENKEDVRGNYIYRTISGKIYFERKKDISLDHLTFSHFYSDYVPYEDFARVVIPDYTHPNLEHFRTHKNGIILGIDDLKKLFKAVSVHYEVRKKFYEDWEDGIATRYSYCTIDNVLEFCLFENLQTSNYYNTLDIKLHIK